MKTEKCILMLFIFFLIFNACSWSGDENTSTKVSDDGSLSEVNTSTGAETLMPDQQAAKDSLQIVEYLEGLVLKSDFYEEKKIAFFENNQGAQVRVVCKGGSLYQIMVFEKADCISKIAHRSFFNFIKQVSGNIPDTITYLYVSRGYDVYYPRLPRIPVADRVSRGSDMFVSFGTVGSPDQRVRVALGSNGGTFQSFLGSVRPIKDGRYRLNYPVVVRDCVGGVVIDFEVGKGFNSLGAMTSSELEQDFTGLLGIFSSPWHEFCPASAR